jgi:uncharacterized protein (TIGR00255 family)
MTGFGRGEAPIGEGAVSAEVRTVNSRFLDLRLRLPRQLAALESRLRAEVSPLFGRGQVDVQVRLPAEAEPAPRVEVDVELARVYADAARRLRESGAATGELELGALFGLPGVVRQLEPDAVTDEVCGAARVAVLAACAEAVAMRQREGATLERDLRQRMERLETLTSEVEGEASSIAKALRERLERRVAQLAPELEVDPSRLDQEIVLVADRIDVTEELVRLHSHLGQFLETLEQAGPIGRRLEFLLQEMAREVNTVGSKAQAARISSRVVDLKTELERVREQVLNVE